VLESRLPGQVIEATLTVSYDRLFQVIGRLSPQALTVPGCVTEGSASRQPLPDIMARIEIRTSAERSKIPSVFKLLINKERE
jgi:hypothetical protein